MKRLNNQSIWRTVVSLAGVLFIGVLISGSLTPVAAQSPEFQEIQSVATNRAYDWEYFSMSGEHYLAVANVRMDSKIYKWNGSNFVEFQSIPTAYPTAYPIDWKFFTIGNDHFLALANTLDYSADSKIYKWDGNNFVEFQSIPCKGGHDWEFFTIGGSHYLALANIYDGSSALTDSKIYKWNGTNFAEFQSVSTSGAMEFEYFMIGSEHYLAVANHATSDTNRWANSKIYKWNGSSFAEFQSFYTFAACDWEHFTIGTDHYLARASYRTDSEPNHKVICKWNGNSFVEVQSFSVTGAHDWESFVIGSDHYLCLSMLYEDSKIYKWNGSSFAEFQSIPSGSGSRAVEDFTIGGDHYLAIANWDDDSVPDNDSKIFKFADLVAYYPFNGNANDESGNGNHGTVHGPTLITDRCGNSDSAYRFDDGPEIITLPPEVMNGLDSFSVGLWMKTSAPFSENDYNYMFSAINSQSDTNIFLLYMKDNGIGKPYINGFIGSGTGLTVVNDDVWHYLTIVRFGSTVKLYVDGAFDSEWTSTSTGSLVIEGLVIGADQDSVGGGWQNGQDFNGTIDDIRVYNRALSESEIQELYSKESCNTVECIEDDSGSIDIKGSPGSCGTSVTIPVRIQNAPNEVSALGFDVQFDPAILTYTGSATGSLIPSNFQSDVSLVSSGRLRFGCYKSGGTDVIPAGSDGNIMLLEFSTSANCDTSQLKLTDLVDDIASWSASPGCFNFAEKCDGDISGDGKITPLDALCAFEKHMGICPTSCGIVCADICCDVSDDGSCTPEDALCIFNKYLGFDSCLD